MINLLFVDDDFDFLNTLLSILKRDFQVSTATCVAEAKRILISETADAVCSDFSMRDGTGLELLCEKGRMTPFLLLSSTEDTTIINKVNCYDATFCGKTDYDLIKKIKTVLNS